MLTQNKMSMQHKNNRNKNIEETLKQLQTQQ